MKHFYLCLLLLLPIFAKAQNGVWVGDKPLRVKFDGRVTLDGALYLPAVKMDGLKYGGATPEDFRFSSGMQITQLRLGFLAAIGERWQAKFDVTLNDRRVTPTDIVLIYNFDQHSRLLMGYYKDPLSMEANTPSKFLSLQTPMAVSMLTHDQRYLGVTYMRTGRHYYLAGGIYSGTSSPMMTEPNRGNDGYGLSARAAWIPKDDEHTTIHIGTSGRWRHVADYAKTLTLSTLPESRIDFRRFVTTSIERTNQYWAGGLEVALRHKRLFFTAEWLGNIVRHEAPIYDPNNIIYGVPSPQLGWSKVNEYADGWTMTASYMLKGNQRTYMKADGLFNPAGNVAKGGNLELFGRVGQVSLDSKRNSYNHQGGSATSYMLGLNWYPNGNILIGANYSYLDHSTSADAGGLLKHNLTTGRFGLNFHTLQLRAQFIF